VDQGSLEKQLQEAPQQAHGYPVKERPAADKLAYHECGPVRHSHCFLAGDGTSEGLKKQTASPFNNNRKHDVNRIFIFVIVVGLCSIGRFLRLSPSP
jgi:hypothetical protein